MRKTIELTIDHTVLHSLIHALMEKKNLNSVDVHVLKALSDIDFELEKSNKKKLKKSILIEI